MIDIDGRKVTEKEIRTMRHLIRVAGFRPVACKVYRSRRGGSHVVWRITPVPRDPLVIVALQAICGSDANRESCNLRRVRLLHRKRMPSVVPWNVLYEP
jgi:hypothetical protein